MMNTRLKVLVSLLVVVSLGASLSLSTQLLGQVVSPMSITEENFNTCLRMDVTRDGTVALTDANTIRATMASPTSNKSCWNLTGEALTICKAQDVNKDNIIDIMDYIIVRQYVLDTTSLKVCTDTSALLAFAQCQNMDVTKDGLVDALDEIAVRSYVFSATTQKTCQQVTDPQTKAQCESYDLDRNGTVTFDDSMLVRLYRMSASTLKVCAVPTPVCPGTYPTNLIEHMTSQIDSRIVGVTATNETKNLFSTRGNDTLPWVRSATVWTNKGVKLDFSGASPWNSSLGYRKAGTLISPRHIVLANHYAIANGAKVAFVDNNNTVVTRTVTAQKRIRYTDIQIAVLDSDVPSSIAFYPILSFEDTKDFGTANIPVIALDQEDHAMIKDALFRPGHENGIAYNPSLVASRKAFDETIINGDSGNPVFLVINDKLALLTTHWLAGSGVYYGALIDDLNAAMTELGGGYQVTKVSASCFKNP